MMEKYYNDFRKIAMLNLGTIKDEKEQERIENEVIAFKDKFINEMTQKVFERYKKVLQKIYIDTDKPLLYEANDDNDEIAKTYAEIMFLKFYYKYTYEKPNIKIDEDLLPMDKEFEFNKEAKNSFSNNYYSIPEKIRKIYFESAKEKLGYLYDDEVADVIFSEYWGKDVYKKAYEKKQKELVKRFGEKERVERFKQKYMDMTNKLFYEIAYEDAKKIVYETIDENLIDKFAQEFGNKLFRLINENYNTKAVVNDNVDRLGFKVEDLEKEMRETIDVLSSEIASSVSGLIEQKLEIVKDNIYDIKHQAEETYRNTNRLVNANSELARQNAIVGGRL